METNKYSQINFNVVLMEPDIPTNTGNIGRLCVGTESKLHLVGPMGFEITDKAVKRAGLDYWPHLDWQYYKGFSDWETQIQDWSRVFMFTTKTKRSVYSIDFRPGDWFVFGKETKGLSEDFLQKYESQNITLPQVGKVRSFNLANSVSMALAEGVRQLHYS